VRRASRRQHPRPSELRARLARLRETSGWLRNRAGIGCELRTLLAKAGSPTWRPAEDLSWRSWIERQGDEEARGLLAAIDELLEEMVTKDAAAGERQEGS
jgi:hypothetical protein